MSWSPVTKSNRLRDRRLRAGRTGTVTPIRTATNQVLRAITVSNLPSVIAITPAPRR
jgi:DNA-binding beta-propeller fold protein YncE